MVTSAGIKASTQTEFVVRTSRRQVGVFGHVIPNRFYHHILYKINEICVVSS